MIIKQLSVFLENKSGRVMAAAKALADNRVNIRALSLADTSEFGILRLIVDDAEKGRSVLSENGLIVRASDVLAIAMPDTPGGMIDTLDIFRRADINIEYMYACVSKENGKAVMIMAPDDITAAEGLLKKAHYENDSVSRLF